MPILVGDIKLAKSQTMEDVPEGGGAPVAAVVADAVSNEIFNDISELDRAGGRVNLRKLFVRVDTNDRDTYLGGNVIVADPPDDPLVSVTIFTTGQTFDTRAEAVSRVEAYLNAGPTWPGYLYENHITGQRSFQLFQRTNQAPPTVGRTLLIRQNEGTGTQREQYVRVTRVESEVRTFTKANGSDYQALIVTCDISDALRYDFTGSPASEFFTKAGPAALIRDTVVADAAVYYGCVPLVTPVAIGDAKAECASAYTQLVPNAVTETSLLDQRQASAPLLVLATTPIQVEVTDAPYSQRIKIGQENRGFNYVSILKPLPSPGTVIVTYRALGNNYTVRDNGDGTLGGVGFPGSGTINYTTGSISVSLNALPDDRTGLMFYWGEKVAFTNRSGQAGFRPPEHCFQLEHEGIEPGTLVLQWTSAGVVKTAVDNGAGQITGHAVGEIAYSSGQVMFRPGIGAFPDPNAEFNIEYEWAEMEVETITGLVPDGTGTIAIPLAEEPAPKSLKIRWLTTRTISESSGASTGGGSSNKSSSSSATETTTKTFVNREYSSEGAIIYSGGAGLGEGQSWS
jgi:hypothetical protein